MAASYGWCATMLYHCTTFFLVYINDLLDNLPSILKLFADGASLYSVINNSNISENELNKDLQKISE